MHLMYHIDPSTGKRVYTLKKVNEANGKATTSAHPGESRRCCVAFCVCGGCVVARPQHMVSVCVDLL